MNCPTWSIVINLPDGMKGEIITLGPSNYGKRQQCSRQHEEHTAVTSYTRSEKAKNDKVISRGFTKFFDLAVVLVLK